MSDESDKPKGFHLPKRGDFVSYGALASIAVVVAGATIPTWWAYETNQNATISNKADKADLNVAFDRFVTELQLLRADMNAWAMKVTNQEMPDSGRLFGQIQTQEQNITVTDWLQSDAKRNFMALQHDQMLKDYGPCVPPKESRDGVHNPADGGGLSTDGLPREGRRGDWAAGGERDLPDGDQRQPGVTAGEDF
jgi:hypothetical protein